MNERNVVKKVIDYIEDHITSDLRLDEIAEEMNYSKFYLSRMFSKEVGCTIYKYIQMRRLTEAADKLVTTNESVVQIAMEANYTSQQAFTLAFRQLYHTTPQVYRLKGSFSPIQRRLAIIDIRNYITNINNCKGMAA